MPSMSSVGFNRGDKIFALAILAIMMSAIGITAGLLISDLFQWFGPPRYPVPIDGLVVLFLILGAYGYLFYKICKD